MSTIYIKAIVDGPVETLQAQVDDPHQLDALIKVAVIP